MNMLKIDTARMIFRSEMYAKLLSTSPSWYKILVIPILILYMDKGGGGAWTHKKEHS
jgi:hypothetical protein